MAYQEYPRFLHKADGSTKIVKDVIESDAALAEGWSITPGSGVDVKDGYRNPSYASYPSAPFDAPVPLHTPNPDPSDANDAEPVKRGPGRNRG